MNSNIFRYKYARLMAAALAAVICTVLPLVGMPALAGSVPCAAENAAAGDAPEDIFTAVVISDLHYTTDPNANNVLVSGMALVDDITDAIIEEVIDRRPDAFILTGDNTNGGAEADVTALAGKLDRIRQAGIAVVMTTGNHDFNQTDAAFYEEQYFPLLPCVDRDAYSLSYTAVFGEVVLFAMDDNAVDPGGIGQHILAGFPLPDEWSAGRQQNDFCFPGIVSQSTDGGKMGGGRGIKGAAINNQLLFIHVHSRSIRSMRARNS